MPGILVFVMSKTDDKSCPNLNSFLFLIADYISFSAHTDFEQTSEFIRILKPPHIVSTLDVTVFFFYTGYFVLFFLLLLLDCE